MNWIFALLAFLSTFVLFFPLYRYFWRQISQNGDEFAVAFKKDYNKDLDESIVTHTVGLADDVADRFVYASLAVFLVPLIPHCFAATALYFLLRYFFV